MIKRYNRLYFEYLLHKTFEIRKDIVFVPYSLFSGLSYTNVAKLLIFKTSSMIAGERSRRNSYISIIKVLLILWWIE